MKPDTTTTNAKGVVTVVFTKPSTGTFTTKSTVTQYVEQIAEVMLANVFERHFKTLRICQGTAKYHTELNNILGL